MRNNVILVGFGIASIGFAAAGFYFEFTKAVWSGIVVGFNFSLIYFLYTKSKSMRLVEDILKDLEKSNRVILGTSDQILNTNRELEEGSLEQSESLHETATALDEINAMAQRSSANCENSTELSRECVSAAGKGKEAVLNLRSSFSKMKEGNITFSNYISESNNKILEISNVIKEINAKTKVINDIVFQTKLLSFNASVEAARAGEHGKGFSVVAEEIGNLANLSGSAADEISSMLEESTTRVDSIVEESQSAVERISTGSVDSISQGEEAVNLCADSLDEISKCIDEVNKSVYEIASATSEQRQGVEEITSAVNLLNQVNQKINLVVGQSKQVAYSVSKESERLDEIVDSIVLATTGRPRITNTDAELFEWNDSYLIHVDDMDNEHQILVEKINLLVESLNTDGCKDTLERYNDMCDYTVEHFTHEEEFMRSFSYSEYDAHKKIHDNLLGILRSHEVDIKNGSVDKQKLVAFLKNWLISHIMGVDTKYAGEYGESHHHRAA
ncbi:bacteriohemerythrin [Halobacteriovorax marinus]|uniref:bacteriohemerythrin n=1 Tax=Halobacteriovorax marinus TaxID=97084 RepID=UPI003A8FECBB